MAYKGKSGKKKNYSRMAKKALASKKSSSNGIKTSQPVINPSLKAVVKRMINNTEEKKFMTASIAYKSNILGTGFNTTSNFGYTTSSSIIPVIQQGIGEQQRVGCKIRPVSFLCRGHVLALPTGTSNPYTNIPFYVRVVIWRQKQSMTTLSNTGFLDDGITGGGNDFDGSLDDLMVPYNKDRFQIAVARTFKLQPSANTGTQPAENLSKYPMSALFKFRIPLPKTLVYNDTASDPSNARWYMSAGIVNFDGQLAINSIIRANITAQTVLTYTDA